MLVTGPTGSGKSTTLYSALNELNSDMVNIVTVEIHLMESFTHFKDVFRIFLMWETHMISFTWNFFRIFRKKVRLFLE